MSTRGTQNNAFSTTGEQAVKHEAFESQVPVQDTFGGVSIQFKPVPV